VIAIFIWKSSLNSCYFYTNAARTILLQFSWAWTLSSEVGRDRTTGPKLSKQQPKSRYFDRQGGYYIREDHCYLHDKLLHCSLNQCVHHILLRDLSASGHFLYPSVLSPWPQYKQKLSRRCKPIKAPGAALSRYKLLLVCVFLLAITVSLTELPVKLHKSVTMGAVAVTYRKELSMSGWWHLNTRFLTWKRCNTVSTT